MTTPILESERIILRPLTTSDANHIFESWTSDPEVAKFMIWDLHKSVDETLMWLKIEEENARSIKHFVWGFILKENGVLFGSGGINFQEDKGCYELGYNIMRKYWGQGLTTEASKVILDFAADNLNQNKFFCRHAADNIGSQKVMLKLGFKHHGDSEYSSFSGKKHFKSMDYYLTNYHTNYKQ